MIQKAKNYTQQQKNVVAGKKNLTCNLSVPIKLTLTNDFYFLMIYIFFLTEIKLKIYFCHVLQFVICGQIVCHLQSVKIEHHHLAAREQVRARECECCRVSV